LDSSGAARQKEAEMMAAMIARTAVLPLLGVAVILGVITSGRGAPAPVVPQTVPADKSTTPAWQTSLRTMDRALAVRDIRAAESAWRDAYGHAIRSRRWEALLAVGEASLRIGDRWMLRQPYKARAREAWLRALFRARDQHSLDGVLEVTEAFRRLGDTGGVLKALRVADTMAGRDASDDARQRALAVRKRLLPRTVQVDAPLAVQASNDRLITADDTAVGR
jgi:hypothetical protein